MGRMPLIYGIAFVIALTLMVSAFNLLFRFIHKWWYGTSALVILILYSLCYPIYTLISSLLSDDNLLANQGGILIGLSLIETPVLMVLVIYLGTYYEEIVFQMLGDY